MEVQRMFDNLLESLDWAEAAKNSYTAFHVQGVSYLNLLRTERLTVKLYTFNNVQHNAQGFLVHPHTHAYNFTHRTMVGKIVNHTFAVSEQNDWNIYSFSTPLNGGAGLTKLAHCGLTILGASLLPPGRSYYLDHEEIHTLSVKTDYAAALLLQFHDVVRGPTAMFAPRGASPDCSSGLYQRMTEREGQRTLEQYNEMLNDGRGG